MLELPPHLKNILREQAANSGQEVGEYLRLLLDQHLDFDVSPGALNWEDHVRED